MFNLRQLGKNYPLTSIYRFNQKLLNKAFKTQMVDKKPLNPMFDKPLQ